MRKLVFALIALTLAAPLTAQQRLNLDFPGLSEKAAEVVDVTLDASMLKLASKFLGNDAEERNARDVVRNLQGIYVRSYEFEHEGEYDRALVDRVRAQLGPSWKKIVDVHKRGRETSEIYVETRGDSPIGMLIISAEPRQLTIVNIVGPIDMDKLASLEGSFGVPHVSAHSKEKSHE